MIVANGYAVLYSSSRLQHSLTYDNIAYSTRDLTVPYPTASISSTDPFDDSRYLDIEIDENNIIQSYHPIPLDDNLISKFGSISTSTTQRMEKDEDEVEVLVTTIHKKPGRIMKVKKRSPPPFPPVLILPLRWPFNYVSHPAKSRHRIFLTLFLLHRVYSFLSLSCYRYSFCICEYPLYMVSGIRRIALIVFRTIMITWITFHS